MTDTRPEVARRYRELLLARSGEERLRIGGSMRATAQALVRASVLAANPRASPADLRRALFLRFYGHEFDADTRARIAIWLGRDDPAPGAAPRRVPVNWDDLEMALTSNAGEWTCYLDLRGGEVLMVPIDRLGDDDWPSEEEIDAGLAAGHVVHIEPLDSRVEYGWMADFAASVRDARLGDRLEVALDGRGAFRRFKDVLLDHPAQRQAWFAFRDERLHDAARDWLADHDIAPTTAPPSRPRSG
ncbi:MAG: hypothetical protein HY726_05050 [Candidatus Rokubacteria bacterium]|nr:hypothetical protein [Candidatus Rokubacteria bacterium]